LLSFMAISEIAKRLAIDKRLVENTIVLASGCHEWQGNISSDGYGRISYLNKKWRVHRLVWTLKNGPIPKGLDVRHYKCDNPPCINIDHLRIGTRKQNVQDMVRHGRQRKSMNKPYCTYGHKLTIENTYVHRNKRMCRECRRLVNRQRYLERKSNR